MDDFKDFTKSKTVDICITDHVELDSINEILSEQKQDTEKITDGQLSWVEA